MSSELDRPGVSEAALFSARRLWLNTSHLMIATGNGFIFSFRFRGQKWNRIVLSRS